MEIEKPCLYDVKRKSLLDGKIVKEEFHKGLYDYERNIFIIPRKFLKLFENKRKEDLEIMREVGLEIVG